MSIEEALRIFGEIRADVLSGSYPGRHTHTERALTATSVLAQAYYNEKRPMVVSSVSSVASLPIHGRKLNEENR